MQCDPRKLDYREMMAKFKSTKDFSKYSFNGAIYNKRRLVHAVVRLYLIDHNNIDLFDLQAIFPKSLNGIYEVICPISEAKRIEKDTGQSRHFIKDHDLLKLNDGQTIAVCTQWGAGINIERFLARAKEIGFVIEKALK
jgi:hypothetical protein